MAVPLLPAEITERRCLGLESECYREGQITLYEDAANWANNIPLAGTALDQRWQARGFPSLAHPVPQQYLPNAPLPAYGIQRRRNRKLRYIKPSRIMGQPDLGNARAEITNAAEDAWTHGVRYLRLLGKGGEGLAALCEISRGGLLHRLVLKVDFTGAAGLGNERAKLKASFPSSEDVCFPAEVVGFGFRR